MNQQFLENLKNDPAVQDAIAKLKAAGMTIDLEGILNEAIARAEGTIKDPTVAAVTPFVVKILSDKLVVALGNAHHTACLWKLLKAFVDKALGHHEAVSASAGIATS